MSRLLISLLAVMMLASCNTKTVKPEYPMNISSVIRVENEDVEYTAEYEFADGKSSFVLLEPTILKGLGFTVADNDITVSYSDISLRYNLTDNNRFSAFKVLHNIIMKFNELQPEFIKDGESLNCEFESDGEKVKITLDCDSSNPDKINYGRMQFDFD